MGKQLFTILAWTVSTAFLFGQMKIDGNTLYGNEWIDYGKTYYKIKLAQDGIYRISAEELLASGVPLNELNGSDLQLYYFGKQVPIKVSTDGLLGNQDFIDFYGKQNKGELDWHIYEEPELTQLNPDYSLITDTSSYFLTWEAGPNERYNEIENDLSGNLPDREMYHWYEEQKIFTKRHQKPVRNEARYSSLDVGEGFGSSLEQNHQFDFQFSHVYAAGPNPKLNIRFVSGDKSHVLEMGINNEVIRIDTFSGYDLKDYTEELEFDLLENDLTLSLEGKAREADRYVVSKVSVSYPRSFTFDNEQELTLTIPSNGGLQYLEIENFRSDENSASIYNPQTASYIQGVIENGILKFILPHAEEDSKIIITQESQHKSVNTIEKVTFTDYTQQDPQYILITGNKLYNDNSLGQNMVETYASYRESDIGGSFDVEIVIAEELYNQFGFGIDRHPIALRNFGQFIKTRWSSAEYIFILGKGLEYNINRTESQRVNNERQNFSVPTFGNPGSDNLLFSSLGDAAPILPVGRIAAQTASDVKLYLDKVMLHENPINDRQNLEDQLWRKKIIHLSGGDTEVLQKSLAEWLDTMAYEISNNQVGAEITTFKKTSSQAVQTATSKELTEKINEGASIITFFGHASEATFDFSIDQARDWDNYGRYPLMIALGCLSGDVHSLNRSLSVNYVLEEDKGAIAFIASAGNAFPWPSFNSGIDMYTVLGNELYGNSIGNALFSSLQKWGDDKRFMFRTLNEQLTLHGDPAVILHRNVETPDLMVDFGSIKTEPAIVSSNLDSFNLIFELFNLGKAVTQNTTIEIRQTLPNGNLTYIDTLNVAIPAHSEIIITGIPVPAFDAIGKNSIQINLDVNNDIEENPSPGAEDNNTLKNQDGQEEEFCFYILDSGAAPISPEDYSIVSKDKVTLKSSTSNAFLKSQKYIIQIDTTSRFDSPLFEQTEITQGGGLIEWQPSIQLQEETVYYWRISPEKTSEREGYTWNNSSFVYLQNEKAGWNQSHFYQIRSADFDGLDLAVSNQLQLDTLGFNISIFNRNELSDESTGFQFNFENFALSLRPWSFIDEGISVSWGDPITGSIKLNDNGAFGSKSVGSGQRFFAYDTNKDIDRENLIDLLTNTIPDGSTVYFIGIAQNENSTYSPELWKNDKSTLGTSIFEILEKEGATLVRSLEERGSIPYNFIYIKGDQDDKSEGIVDSTGFVKTDFFVPIRGTEGQMNSTIIGPAKTWDRFSWRESRKEAGDYSHMRLYGVDQDELRHELDLNIMDKEYDLSNIDASVYPYLELEYYVRDDSLRSSPNLDFWRVYYERLPEVALNPEALFTFQADTLQQGEELIFETAVDNISSSDMDSLLVNFTLLNSANVPIVEEQRLAPLPKESRLTASYRKNTIDLQGRYQFSFEINPDKDQAEQHEFNNFAIKEIFIQGDNKNPLLDVTFDGVHILDGDIVSANPNILIELNDDNQFLPITDIEAFDLSMLYPNESQARPISLSDPNLRFTPATPENKQATLEYNPNLEEGIYKLFVQGRDVSGNDSAQDQFSVTFEVVKERKITNILNYPNPFSNSTQFVFTLTGQVPDVFIIRIMTLSGKVVKEITKDELGEIRLGTNKTKYRWTGTDDFGNQLANGVYLYKVIMYNENGEEYEKMINESEQYFTKGIGKMVLLR